MKVGDPRKAIVLSVVAVIIVGVAVFRALPSGGAPAPQGAVALRTSDEKPVPPVAAADPEPTPAIDAFSHPNLSKSEIPGKEEPPKSSDRTQSDVRPPQSMGVEESLPPPGSVPAGITGINQQTSVGDAVLLVRLDAIVRSDSAMAAFTVAGKSTAPCKAGALINGHIKVVRIQDSSVVIEVMKRRYELSVGQEVAL